MQIKRFLLQLMLLLALAVPLSAQDQATSTVSYGDFSVTVASDMNLQITQYAGDPVNLEQPGGAEPAYTQIRLFKADEAPGSLFEHGGSGGFRIYDRATLADYMFYPEQVAELETLLAERPDLNAYMKVTTAGSGDENLPFLPVAPAAQVIRACAEYVELDGVTGIVFLTAYRQDASPFGPNDFIYTFQGLSNDGEDYIMAIFPVTSPLFTEELPADFSYETFLPTIDDYLNDVIAQFNNGDASVTSPSIDELKQIISTISSR